MTSHVCELDLSVSALASHVHFCNDGEQSSTRNELMISPEQLNAELFMFLNQIRTTVTERQECNIGKIQHKLYRDYDTEIDPIIKHVLALLKLLSYEVTTKITTIEYSLADSDPGCDLTCDCDCISCEHNYCCHSEDMLARGEPRIETIMVTNAIVTFGSSEIPNPVTLEDANRLRMTLEQWYHTENVDNVENVDNENTDQERNIQIIRYFPPQS